MTNSSVGDLMYAGVRAFGWFFWLWHRIKQKIGKSKKLNLWERTYSKVIKTIFRAILSDERFEEEKKRYTKY